MFGLGLDHFLTWPCFIRGVQTDPTSARRRLWIMWILLLWCLTIIGVGIWIWNERSWTSLALKMPRDWRLWGSVILIIAFVLLQAQAAAQIARHSLIKTKVKAQLGHLAIMLPHSQGELPIYLAASLSAGFCEEFLFRGYLIWAFQPLLGWWGAAAFSLTAFTAAHLYQGVGGAFKAALGGGLFTGMLLVSDSLYPAVLLHALIDISGGIFAWLVFRNDLGMAAPE